jgi:hypothetical protein
MDAFARETRRIAQEALARALGLQANPPPAPDIETVVTMYFSWDTPSPLVLQTVTAGQVLNRAAILIQTPFSDSNAYLELGTTGDPGAIFSPIESDVGTATQFESRLLYAFPSNDLLILAIHPGSSTQGSGILLYKVK